MRKKLKELLHKEEGFTLVELLAVIVILGIIVAIAIPAIGNVIGTAEDGASDAEKELVIDAARLYVLNDGALTDDKVTVETLIEEGYLEKTSSENVSTDDFITVETLDNGNHKFTFGAPTP